MIQFGEYMKDAVAFVNGEERKDDEYDVLEFAHEATVKLPAKEQDIR